MVDIASRADPMKDIAILAYPGCMGTEVFALADVLLIANHLAAALEPGRKPPMAVRVVSARREPVRLAGGFVLQAQALRGAPELLVVPGLEVSRFGQWDKKLGMLGPEIALIRRRFAHGATLASVCIGTFLLAEAGALDGLAFRTRIHRALPVGPAREAGRALYRPRGHQHGRREQRVRPRSTPG